MKTINIAIILASILGIMTGCHKDENYSEELSQQDRLALESMDEAFEIASLYNDSLSYCSEDGNSCTPAFIQYCDSIYHMNIDEYDQNHNRYSHNNIEDDHHHGGGKRNHGGNMDGHDNSDNHDHHNQDDHDDMGELTEDHTRNHPI